MGRAAVLTILIGALQLGTAAGGDVALIVHPGNPERDLSSSVLAKIFRKEQQHWSSGGRVYLILQESGSPEKDMVLRRIYRMSEAELKQFWLGKLYRGEIASFPRVASSNAAVKRIVSQAPNALGFIDASVVDATVKVLRLDGKKPGEPGYLLGGASH